MDFSHFDRTELVDKIEQKDEQIEEPQRELDKMEFRRTREETNYGGPDYRDTHI